MDYPEAHADDLLEVFPGPVGEKSLNPRQSYKVSLNFFALFQSKLKFALKFGFVDN